MICAAVSVTLSLGSLGHSVQSQPGQHGPKLLTVSRIETGPFSPRAISEPNTAITTCHHTVAASAQSTRVTAVHQSVDAGHKLCVGVPHSGWCCVRCAVQCVGRFGTLLLFLLCRLKRSSSLCCLDTKLTAAYSSSAEKTKRRHTAIQISMAFT